MKKKFVFFWSAGITTLLISCSCFAEEIPNRKRTMWNVVDKSLTDLLNEGWKPVNQISDRAAIATTRGEGAFDEQTFGFLLVRNGKYITCLITNPKVVEGAYSRCRALN
jgi:hypothetical protein